MVCTKFVFPLFPKSASKSTGVKLCSNVLKWPPMCFGFHYIVIGRYTYNHVQTSLWAFSVLLNQNELDRQHAISWTNNHHTIWRCMVSPVLWFNIEMSPYHYRESHCGDKTVVRSSYLHNGISYAGMMTSLFYIKPPGLYGLGHFNANNIDVDKATIS